MTHIFRMRNPRIPQNKSFISPGSLPRANKKVRSKVYGVRDVDNLIAKDALHWLVCLETYEIERRSLIGDWELTYEDVETNISESRDGHRFPF